MHYKNEIDLYIYNHTLVAALLESTPLPPDFGDLMSDFSEIFVGAAGMLLERFS